MLTVPGLITPMPSLMVALLAPCAPPPRATALIEDVPPLPPPVPVMVELLPVDFCEPMAWAMLPRVGPVPHGDQQPHTGSQRQLQVAMQPPEGGPPEGGPPG